MKQINHDLYNELVKLIQLEKGNEYCLTDIASMIKHPYKLSQLSILSTALIQLGQKYKVVVGKNNKVKRIYQLSENQITNLLLKKNMSWRAVGVRRKHLRLRTLANFIFQHEGETMSVRELWGSLTAQHRNTIAIRGVAGLAGPLKMLKLPLER